MTSLADSPMVAFQNLDGTFAMFGLNDAASTQVISIRVIGGAEQRFVVGAHELFTLRGPAGLASPNQTPSLAPGMIIRSIAGDAHMLDGTSTALTRH